MPRSRDISFKKDVLRLFCFLGAVLLAAVLFIGTPALTIPSLSAIVLATLLSPWVASLERRGFPRKVAILSTMAWIVAVGSILSWFAIKNWEPQWADFQSHAPAYFESAVSKLSAFEGRVRRLHPLLAEIHFAEKLSSNGVNWGSWLAEKGSAIIGNVLGCLLLTPILTFFLLSQGRNLRRRFFMLVPNRFFESVYIVTHGVFSAMSDYIRAKMIEAFLVGAMTTLGLACVQTPYALPLGLWAGITNIVPYIGPLLGAAPAILLAVMNSSPNSALLGLVIVYTVANLIDALVIFPGIVAKLVNLNPLVLIASVVIGQYYYGIIGMLVSIPIAAAIKVVLYEFYVVIYGFTPDVD